MDDLTQPPPTTISRLGAQLALDFWAHWFFECFEACAECDDALGAYIGGGEL